MIKLIMILGLIVLLLNSCTRTVYVDTPCPKLFMYDVNHTTIDFKYEVIDENYKDASK
jgi:hypothetical protein